MNGFTRLYRKYTGPGHDKPYGRSHRLAVGDSRGLIRGADRGDRFLLAVSIGTGRGGLHQQQRARAIG